MTTSTSTARRFRHAAGVGAAFAAFGFVAAVPASASTTGPTGVVTASRVSANPATDVGSLVRNSAGAGFADVFGPGTDDGVSPFVFIEAPATMTDADHATYEVPTFCVEIGDPFIPVSGGLHASGARALTSNATDKQQRLRGASWIATHATAYDPTTGAVLGVMGTTSPDPTSGQADGAWGQVRFATSDGFTVAQFRDAEAAATQLAIWALVGDRDISGTISAAVLNRANELVALAKGDDATWGTADDRLDPIAPHSYTLDIAAGDGASAELANLTVTLDAVSENAGADVTGPVAGVSVTVTATGLDLDPATAGTQDTVTAATAADGTIHLDGVAKPGADVTVSAATTNLLLAPGTLLDTDDPQYQQVITAHTHPIVRTAATVIAAYVPPTTTAPATTAPATTAEPTTVPVTTAPATTVPGPQPTAPATTAPHSSQTNLPKTGSPITSGLVLVAIAIGGLAVTLLRRRRPS